MVQDDNKVVSKARIYSSFLASFSTASVGAGVYSPFDSPPAEQSTQGSTLDPSEPEAKRHRMTTATPAMHQAHMAAARTLSRMPSIEAARLAAAVQDMEERPEHGADSAAAAGAAAEMDLSTPRPLLVAGPGQFGGQVGLLDALQPPEAIKYLTPEEGGPPKSPPAPRMDLSHLTEEEKVDRHRELARLNNQRKRAKAALTEQHLQWEVTQMRTYKYAVDAAPYVILMLSADIGNYRILFVNKTVTEMLGFAVDKLLGRVFLQMAHPQDRPHFSSVLSKCVSTFQPPHERTRCRFWCMNSGGNNNEPFKQVEVTVTVATQGLICTLREVPHFQ